MTYPAIHEDVSPAVAAVLRQLFDSHDAQAFVVADYLNTVASDDEEQATDAFLVTCAEEIIAAAQRVIEAAVGPRAAAAEAAEPAPPATPPLPVSATLPEHFEAIIYHRSEGGPSHYLARGACIAADQKAAAAILLARYWDARLDAAGQSPVFEWVDVALDTFELKSRDGRQTYRVSAVSQEEALEMLRAVHPSAEIEIDAADTLVVRLANGYQLRSGWRDKDDPDALPAGDYLSVLDAKGQQVFYVDAADLLADPVNGRRLLCNLLQACSPAILADGD